MKRFEGDDFMFRLTKDEANTVLSRSQIATLNTSRGNLNKAVILQNGTSKRGGTRKLPYAFTEQDS